MLSAAWCGAATAADVIKADNTNALNLTTSWSGGVVPGSGDVAVWNNTVTTSNTVALGGSLSWQGLRLTNPGGDVRITGAQTLTLGTGGVEVSGGTANLTLASNVALGSTQSWYADAGRTITATGVISGASGLVKAGAGTLSLTNANTFSGDLLIASGTVVNLYTANNTYPNATGLGDMTITGRTVTTSTGATLVFANYDAIGQYNYGCPTALVADGGTITRVANTTQFNSIGNLELRNGGRLTTTNGNNAGATVGSFAFNGSVTVSGTSGSFIDTLAGQTSATFINLGTATGATTFDVAATGDATADLTVSAELADKVLTGVGAGGAASLIKAGAGTMLIRSVNTYSGNTTIDAGVLQVAAPGSLYSSYNGSAVVTVNSGATLKVDSFAYGTTGGLGQLRDRANARVLNGGTIEVVGSSESSGNNFTVADGSTGAFKMTQAGQTLTLDGNAGSNIVVGGALTFGGAGNITVNEAITDNTAAGSIIKAGGGTLTLAGANTYTGDTTISSGTFVLGGSGVLGGGAYSGAITNNAAVVVSTAASQVLSGAIGGNGSLVKSGAGRLTLAGVNTTTGPIAVDGGTLAIDGQTTTPIGVNAGGAIGGIGTAGTVTLAAGATVAPGNGTGLLTVGNMSWSGSSAYQWQMYDYQASEGTGWDSLLGTGTLAINATAADRFAFNLVSLSGTNTQGPAYNWSPTTSGSFRLASFAGGITLADPSGTWWSLNTSGFTPYSSMLGTFSLATTSNDLYLVYTSSPTPAYVWTAGSGAWGTGSNWSGSTAPSGSPEIVFVGAGGTSNNNIASGTGAGQLAGVQSLTFSGSATGAYTITGNALTLGTGIVNQSAHTQTVQNAITLAGGATVDAAAADLVIRGAINTAGNTLYVSGSANTSIESAVTGSGGISKVGAGTLALTGTSTFTGDTSVSAGRLQIAGAGQLGGGSYGGAIANGGELSVATSADQTLSGVISGTGSITKSGAGTLTLSGTNTFTGQLTVAQGKVSVAAVNNQGSSGPLGSGTNPIILGSSGATGVLGYTGVTASTANRLTLAASGSGGVDVVNGTTLTVSGAIEGSGGLVKQGGGMLSLSGPNSFTGDLLISSGTVQNLYQANNTNPTATGLGDMTISGRTVTAGPGATLVFGISDAIGQYNYGAATTLVADGGTITRVANTTQFNSIGNLALRNGGRLTTTNGNYVTVGSFAFNGGVSVSGTSGSFIDTLAGQTTNSYINLGTTYGTTTFDVAATGDPTADLTVSARLGDKVLGGAAGLTKAGAGTMLIAGVNSYTGNTTIDAGVLQVSGSGSLYSSGAGGSAVVTVNSGAKLKLDSFAYGTNGGLGQLRDRANARVLNGGTIDVVGASESSGNNFTVADGSTGTFNMTQAGQTLTLAGNANSNIVVGGALTFGGAGDIAVNETITDSTSPGSIIKAGNGTLTYGASMSYTGATTISSGTLVVGPSGLLGGGAYAGAITNDAALVVNTAANQVLSGAIGGTGSLVKSGASRLTLAGVNTSTGPITVGGGTLVVDGQITTAAIGVSSGAVIGGSGTAAGVTLAAGATVSPGNSPGLLTVGNMSWSGSSAYEWQMYDYQGGMGTGWDSLAGSGTLSINATAANRFAFNLISLSGSNTAGPAYNWSPTTSGSFRLASFAGGITLADPSGTWWNLNTSGFTPYSSTLGTFSLATTSNDLYLVYTKSLTTSYVWTAGSGSWSAGSNWSGSTAPSGSPAIVFAGSGGTSTNNITGGTNAGQLATVQSLTFSGSATGAYTVTGNALSLGTLGVVNQSAHTQTVQNAITLAGGATVDASTADLVLSGAIDTAGNTLYVSGANDTTIGSAVTGAGGISKLGNGVLSLSGSNTFSGGVTLSGGQLDIGNASALGSGAVTIAGGTISNTSGAALTLASNNVQTWSGDLTFSGPKPLNFGIGAVTLAGDRQVTVASSDLAVGGAISGAASLTKTGAGTLTLSGSNAFTGNVVVSQGTLSVPTVNDVGAAGPLGASSAAVVLGSANAVGAIAFTGTNASTNRPFAIATGGTGSFDVPASTKLTASAGVSGTGGLTKTGAGTLALGAVGGYSGPITIASGTLEIGGSGQLGGGAYTSEMTNNGTLVLASSASQLLYGPIGGTGGITSTIPGGFYMGGTKTYSGTTTIGGGGYLEVAHGEPLTIANSVLNFASSNGYRDADIWAGKLTVRGLTGPGIIVANGVNNAFSGTALEIATPAGESYSFDGSIRNSTWSGWSTLAMEKTGAGTQILTGNNSFSGGTLVSAGALVVNGRLSGAGAVTVASGATIAGSGTIAGETTIQTGATLSPGASPGTLTLTSGLTWNEGGSYNWQMLSGTGDAGSSGSWDLVNVVGSLSIAATSANPFNLNLWTLSSIQPDVSGSASFSPWSSQTWTIASAAGGINGFSADKFVITTSATNGTGGFANNLYGGTFSLAQSGNDLNLVFTANTTVTTINVASGTQTQTQAGYPLLSGPAPVVKTGAGKLVLDKANTLTGSTTVQAGTLQLSNGSALSASRLVVVAGGTGQVAPQVVTSVAGLDLATGNGLLDLTAGALTISSGMTAPQLVAEIMEGRGDGSWNGTSGITSSSAAAAVASLVPRAVGWIDNGDGSLTAAYACPGDTNLDWSVDILDASNFLAFGKFDTALPATWIEGDFGYDGIVDILDAADFFATGLYDVGNYNGGAGMIHGVAAVPEPSVLALGVVGLLAAACGVKRRCR